MAEPVEKTGSTRSSSYSTPQTGIFAIIPASAVPESWIPYAELMRLDRPAGFYAIYFSYLIGLGYAANISNTTVSARTICEQAVLMFFGCIFLRGVSCTWNDNIDQDFDRAVARCQNRPIARGAVTTAQGHLFTIFQLVVGMVFLRLWPVECAVYQLITIILAAIYPFGKRFTHFAQLILGFPIACAFPFTCHALGVDPWSEKHFRSTVSLIIANVLWTMIYDTVYAHQDLKDDLKAGVKSMAVLFRNNTKVLSTVLGIVQIILLMHIGVHLELSSLYFVVGCGGVSVSLLAMIILVNLKDPSSCAWWFRTDFWLVGGSLTAGFFAEWAYNRQ